MFKISVIHKFFIISVLSSFSSTAIAASFATTDDYDWVVMKTPIDPASYKYDCNHDYKYETHAALQNCLYNLREDADNAFSKQWGIEDR
ncbi:hypothetical protein, partial [Psychrobacter sp. DAB_AL32B]|uniref:hypothetical protein n=1 Tax=Psychrobacter sp. DAB_AL32B TaxID=1028414 RepID=UPI000B9D451C